MQKADGSIVINVDLDEKEAQKELNRLTKEIRSLEDKLNKAEGKKSPLEQQAESIRAKMQEATAEAERYKRAWVSGVSGADREEMLARERVAQLGQEYESVIEKINKVDAEITQTVQSLDTAKTRAGELSQQLWSAGENSEKMERATKKASKSMSTFAKRLKGIVASAFVFNLLSAGLRTFTQWVGKVIKINDEATAAIARLKGALLTLAQPILDIILPAFTAFVNILADLITMIARFVAALFGTTLEDASASAEALQNEQNAIEGVGTAAKKATKQLAAFDEINQLMGDTADGVAGSIADTILPDFSSLNLMGLPNWLKELTFDLEAKIRDLKFEWDEGTFFSNKDAWIIALSGILGAVIGGMFGGLSGSVIGLLLGLSIGLISCTFLDKLENPDKAKSVFIVVLSAILGAVIGGIFGGLPGAAIGLLLGLSIGLISCEFLDKLDNPDQAKDLFMVVLGAILGAVLGGMFGGLPGAAIGLLLGVLVSLIAIEFKKGEASTWDEKDTITVVLSAILGAILGAAFGGLVGAVIGLLLGATISFVSIKFNEGNYDKDAAIATLRIALFAILGAILGTMFGGFAGTIVGLILGMTIGFASVGFDEQLEASVRTAAQKALKVSLTAIIGALIGAVFGGGVFGGIVGGVIGLVFGLAVTLNKASIEDRTALRGGSMGAGRYSSVTTGSSSSRSLPELSSFSLPRLATGAVIPPNREFMAVLGDNKTETEVVSPLSTMKQAMIEALREAGGIGSDRPIEVNVILDKQIVGRVMVNQINDMTRAAGKPVLLY